MSLAPRIHAEEIHPRDRDLIGRTLWLFERWAPSELEPYAYEAHALIEDLAIGLLDARRDRDEARELLSRSLALNHEQDNELDEMRRRGELVPAA